jgi:hypothetical protein
MVIIVTLLLKSIGTCVEMTAGVVQVGLMWFLFTVM